MIDISKISGNQIDRSRIIHSSGIRLVSQKSAFGSTSNETFSARQTTENNRQHISSYNTANIHANRSAIRPFSSGARADVTPVTPGVRQPSTSSRVVQTSPASSLRHRYDPYSR